MALWRFGNLAICSLLLRVLLFAAIGAAATVLVAWGCALWVPTGVEGELESGELNWSTDVGTDWPSNPTNRATFRVFGRQVVCETIRTTLDQKLSVHSLYAHEAGWPSTAFVAREQMWVRDAALLVDPPDPGTTGHTNTGIVLPYYWANQWGDDAVLPFHPLWPGFLVDTAFWGGAAFIVWSVPGFVRRRARRRRGRCVRCGYELAGVAGVCPECGS